MRTRFVDLDGATTAEMVVVIDVLRAFTTVAWAFHQGAGRVLAVDTAERAVTLRERHLPDALIAGEIGGAPIPGFDLGNSPSALLDADLTGRTIVHRTSAGTQGLARTADSEQVLAASFVTAAATAAALRAYAPAEVTFVITGASHGRDGDEDLACAELIAARAAGDDPDPAPFLARVAASDAGAVFTDGGPEWAPPADLAMACELDRFAFALHASRRDELHAIEVVPQH